MRGPVLVLRALGLGDALTGVPALRGLRRLYPDRQLVLAGKEPFGSWLVRLGVADDSVATAGLSGRPPGRGLGRHLAVNLHGRGPQSHLLLQSGDPDELLAFDCAAAGHRSKTRWRADEHEVDRWCRLVAEAGGACSRDDLRLPLGGRRDAAVVVHPGAASVSRQWPLDRWRQVVQELRGDGRTVVLTGTETELCAELARGTGTEDLSGRLSVDELASRIGSAELLVSGDTGVAHLATAAGTRSVTLFGPTPPAWWGPAIDPERHTVLYRGSGVGDPHADQVDEGLLRITVPEVLRAARKQLASGTTQQSSPALRASRPAASS
ncbi:glycosyltransferase family 9 protein [Kribbella sp. CA-293567]|uniref:glycosyltransferase family 9 protein n=1 Tax=Kribbella sp. CA-293567 TaxID=3002436 RepID=UPI0022DE32C6|nr:glycosyltransferase family 9 protein [Kribbella sp. CA-293567]WBQ08312.1 glycosyltransferase family 9 protein [Kribbella sp. CA-293567]